MGHFPTAEAKEALDQALSGPTLLRREAVNAYANAFGESSVGRLSQRLEHDDALTRIVAIKALGAMRSPMARAAIEVRMRVELAEEVRQAGSAALSR
jgi:HEAT repeat protein